MRKIFKRKIVVSSFCIFAMLCCSLCLTGCDDTDRIKENTVIVAIQQELDSLDPHLAVASGTKEILFNIFEGLVKSDVNGDFKPAIAESYEISEDYLSYKFIIRDGIKFHNGKTLEMKDIIYSLNRGIENAKSNSPLKNIEDIIEADAATLELQLKEPDTDLLVFLTTAIVPYDYDKQETSPVGTGPFKFSENVPLEKIVLVKNDDYYIGDKKAKLDKVIFKIVSSVDSALLELKAGGIDIFPYLTSDKTDQVKDSFNILEGNQNLIQLMALNNAVEPFNDIRVRKAMNFALDKQAIINVTSYGYGTAIGTNMSPKSMPEYYNKAADSVYTKNIEQAKALLNEAGYENGFEFTFKVPSNYQFHVDTAKEIASQLKAAGITANIDLVDWSTWTTDVYAGRNYQATIIGFTPDLSPRAAVSRYYSEASDNFINFKNTEFDSIFDLAIKETDKSKKIEYYKELQLILANDAASVYIQDPSMLVAVNKKLEGYKLYPVYVQDMSGVYYK